MIDGDLVRKKVDEIYTRIKEAEADLQYLRDNCGHEHSHVVMSFKDVTGAEDSMMPKKRIYCDHCDKLLKTMCSFE